MDLTQLANLGEFIGGVAVLVTLIYLALQVRQTKEAVRVDSARSTVQDYRSFLFQLMDPERMSLFRRAITHFEDMPPNDQAQVHVYLTAVLWAAQQTYAQGQRGAVESGVTMMVESFNWAMLRSPGIAAWWAQFKVFFPEDFVKHVEDSVRQQEGLPTVPEALSWYRWEVAELGT